MWFVPLTPAPKDLPRLAQKKKSLEGKMLSPLTVPLPPPDGQRGGDRDRARSSASLTGESSSPCRNTHPRPVAAAAHTASSPCKPFAGTVSQLPYLPGSLGRVYRVVLTPYHSLSLLCVA